MSVHPRFGFNTNEQRKLHKTPHNAPHRHNPTFGLTIIPVLEVFCLSTQSTTLYISKALITLLITTSLNSDGIIAPPGNASNN